PPLASIEPGILAIRDAIVRSRPYAAAHGHRPDRNRRDRLPGDRRLARDLKARRSTRPPATGTTSTSARPASFRWSWSRALVGTVQVTEPGSYTVKAEPAIEGGVEPKILLGK
ncbi:MAG: hypothetical protein ACHQCI_05540, partial [Solirubrobacterales bacterium]